MYLLNDLAVPNEHFYARLPINQIPLDEILLKDALFFTVPENWHVIVTDIKGSTEAVTAGLHQQINLIATGSTVASLNIVFNNSISIPFFFGGDGATIFFQAFAFWVVEKNSNQLKKNKLFSGDLFPVIFTPTYHGIKYFLERLRVRSCRVFYRNRFGITNLPTDQLIHFKLI
jgi:hypothetical protein